MINTTILNYKVSKLLGEGGMAKVYYGENSIGHKVAIKILKKEYAASDELRARFINEAKIMMKLDHQNIRKMYNVDDIDGQLVIIMEYLEGETLSGIIHSNKYVDLKDAFNKCKQALIYSHSKGIIHRDIKPLNIFITSDGSVKIMDFGIAKSDVGESYTRTGQTMGTITYMSPEQVKDPKRVTNKTDIYSLGVTFYHALTKNLPYDLNTDSEFTILTKIVQEPLDLTEIQQDWKTVLSDCLEKDPLKRKELSEIDFQEKTNLVGEDFEKTTIQPDNSFQEMPTLPNEGKIIDKEPVITHSQIKENNKLVLAIIIGLLFLVGLFAWKPWSSKPLELETKISLPKLTTHTAHSITENSAKITGNITDLGNGNIIEKGFCYSVEHSPTINDRKTSGNINTADFTVNLGNLKSNTKYYVRAYAINEAGVAYGGEESFTTKKKEFNNTNNAKEVTTKKNVDNNVLTPYNKGSKWGFKNKYDQVVISPKYEYAYSFKEGFAVVRLNRKYGYINKRGQVVIDIKYDDARSFTNGRGEVNSNGRWINVDKNGKEFY